MARKYKYDIEAIELVESGCFDIVQQINGGPEEPYEGCEHNLLMILNDSDTKVTLLDPSDPQARKECKTYKAEFEMFVGHCVLIIWKK